MRYLSLVGLLFVFLFLPQSTFAAISLSISNLQKETVGYSLTASVSGLSSSANCYVQVAITAPGTPHYFGKTWGVKGEWFNYFSSPEKEFIQENFPKLENDQPTKIIFDNNTEDEDYHGPGEYLVKVNRYTGNSSSAAGDSNSLSLSITDPVLPSPTSPPTASPTENTTPTTTQTQTPTTTPTKTPTPTSVKTPTPTQTKTPTPTNSPKTTKTPVLTPSQSPTTTSQASISAVLGASSSTELFGLSPTPTNIKKKSTLGLNDKYSFLIGISIAGFSGGLLYFRHRKD